MDHRYIKIMGSCLLIVGVIFALPLPSLEIPLSIIVLFIGMILFVRVDFFLFSNRFFY